jgi:prevent-host-death family protein
MEKVNIHEAKTRLSALVDRASKGESIIIAKAGKPMAVIEPYLGKENRRSKIGFMPEIVVPDDFDDMFAADIAALFRGDGS